MVREDAFGPKCMFFFFVSWDIFGLWPSAVFKKQDGNYVGLMPVTTPVLAFLTCDR